MNSSPLSTVTTISGLATAQKVIMLAGGRMHVPIGKRSFDRKKYISN